MKVEYLPREKYDELHEFLLQFGEAELPDSRVSVDVLRDEGKIIGAVMRQRIIHVGPFYLAPEKLGGVAGGLLIRQAIESANGTEVHVVCLNSASEQACERLGLERVEGSLWIRE